MPFQRFQSLRGLVRNANMLAKRGNLPDTILPEDGRETVRQKLRHQSISSEFKPDKNVWEDTYVIPKADLKLVFDADADEIVSWQVSMKKNET